MFHHPMPTISDDPARVGQPDSREWSDGEREQMIEDRADQIYRSVNRLLDNWWSDGKTIKVSGCDWTPSDVFESISRDADGSDMAKLLRGCKATADRLVLDWSYNMAEKEVDWGMYGND